MDNTPKSQPSQITFGQFGSNDTEKKNNMLGGGTHINSSVFCTTSGRHIPHVRHPLNAVLNFDGNDLSIISIESAQAFWGTPLSQLRGYRYSAHNLTLTFVVSGGEVTCTFPIDEKRQVLPTNSQVVKRQELEQALEKKRGGREKLEPQLQYFDSQQRDWLTLQKSELPQWLNLMKEAGATNLTAQQYESYRRYVKFGKLLNMIHYGIYWLPVLALLIYGIVVAMRSR